MFSLCRLVCKLNEKVPNQNLNITLEIHEGEVEGDYSIEGMAQVSGFSVVVRMTLTKVVCKSPDQSSK